MAVIRIEGVEFESEDAREFYERVVVYFEAGPPPPGNPETQRAGAAGRGTRGSGRWGAASQSPR